MNAIHSSQLQLGKCGAGSSPHLPGEGQSRSELSPVFTAWTSQASTRCNSCLQQEEHYQWQGKVLLFLFPLQSRDVGLCVPQQTSNQLMPWLCCSTPSVLHRTGSKLVSLSIAHHFWSGNHRSPSNFLVLSTPSSPIQILDVGFRLIQRWVFGPVIRVQINRRPSGWGLVSFQPTVNEKIYQGCHGKPTQSLRCFLRKSSLLVFLGPRKVLFAQLESETVCFSYLLHMASLMYF